MAFELKTSRLLRFLLVGVLNTAFSYSLYVSFVWAGLHFATANLCATAVGIVFSFRTQGALVFGNRDWRLLRRFVPVWIFVYGINVALIAVFVRGGFNPYVAGALALPPTVALAFLLQRRFVFAADRGEPSTGS